MIRKHRKAIVSLIIDHNKILKDNINREIKEKYITEINNFEIQIDKLKRELDNKNFLITELERDVKSKELLANILIKNRK